MIIRCCDVEATGLDPAQGAAVVEIGWTDMVRIDDPTQWEIRPPRSVLVNPGHPIPPEMSAIHHITDADVAAAPRFVEAFEPLMADAHRVVFCAHRASFERLFITTPTTWICSWKVALHLAPNAPSHALQALRYWLKLEVDPELASPPHRAGPDAYICAKLVRRMLTKLTVEQMITISGAPAFLPRLHFGEHAEKPISEVPADYLTWILKPGKRKPFDEDTLHTAFTELARRRAA